MADKKPDQEPSIEEILASIRQIISDDEEGGASPVQSSAPPPPPPDPPPRPAPPPPPPPPPPDDVIDLTDKVDPEPEPEAAFVEQEPESPPIQVELRDSLPEIRDDGPGEAEDEDRMEPQDNDAAESVPLTRTHYADEQAIDSLLTQRAESAALSAFSRIAARAPVYRDDTPEDGHTIEDVVRGLLRPLLREWLDENLPPMIERLVQRELERLARRTMAE